MLRSRSILGAAVLSLLTAGVRADDGAPVDASKKACADASLDAQKLRADGKLAAAKDKLLACTQPLCPGPIRKDCETWLHEVEATIPTIIVSVRDDAGNDLVDVMLTIDGKLVDRRLDGRAIALDPGAHDLHFESTGHVAVDQRVVLREGDQRRAVTVVLRAAGSTVVAPRPEHATSVTPWIVTGVAVVALGSFTYFGLKGRSEMVSLRDCKPDCNQSDVDAARKKLLVADVSLGVTLVASGIATWLFLSHDDEPAKSPVHVGFAPLAGGGAFAGLSTSF